VATVMAVGAGASCTDVPGNAAVVVRVELPEESGPPLSEHMQLHFTVSSTGPGAETVLAAKDYEWTSPYGPQTYTIRGIAVGDGQVVRVEARLLDARPVDLGGDHEDVSLTAGAQSPLVTLIIGWNTLTDGGSRDAAPADGEDAPPDHDSADRPASPGPDAPIVTCREGDPCGSCGRISCSGGLSCKGDGRSEKCGACGTRRCENWGSWSDCQASGQQSCGQCGFQTCQAAGTTSVWGACQPSGQTRPCPTGSGTQGCGSFGNWDPICRK
jgi:hypothetical protein